MLSSKVIFKKRVQHSKLSAELRSIQENIIKNHKKDIFYKCGLGGGYTHVLMDYLTTEESEALDRIYAKYDIFVKSLGRVVYDVWLDLDMCDVYDYNYIKNLKGFTERELLSAFETMKKVGILVYIGENEKAGTEEYMQTLYYTEVKLNRRIDKILVSVNRQYADKIKEMSAESVLKEVEPYMPQDLYILLQRIYLGGSLDISIATEYLIQKGNYVYPDSVEASIAATAYLKMLLEKGFIKKLGDLYVSNTKT